MNLVNTLLASVPASMRIPRFSDVEEGVGGLMIINIKFVEIR